MDEEQKGMKPIWYFVGWMLTMIGILVVIAGFMNLYITLPQTSVVGHIHPDLWWGGLITITGLIYIWWNRNRVVE